MVKNLGDFTLKEIAKVCEVHQDRYGMDACTHCPFQIIFDTFDGVWYECKIGYFDLGIHLDKEGRQKYLSAKIEVEE